MAVDLHSETEFDLHEGDLEKLESDVKQMAMKISKFRQTLPYHLRNTLDSALSSLRPVSSTIVSGSDPSRLAITGTEEQDIGERMIQLEERVSRNVANIPKVAKRVRECVERINKLDSLDSGTIHPAFTRRRRY